jgi:hypothetical protein
VGRTAFSLTFARSLALAASSPRPSYSSPPGRRRGSRDGRPRRGPRSAMDPALLAHGAPPARACRGGRLSLRSQCEPHVPLVPTRRCSRRAFVSFGSLAFSFFLGGLSIHSVAYGRLGTAITLLLFLYFSAAVLLFSAELNAELRRDTPREVELRRKRPNLRDPTDFGLTSRCQTACEFLRGVSFGASMSVDASEEGKVGPMLSRPAHSPVRV